jgi:tRNA-(ms[2]io[6]A)-hydroxylase
MNQTLEPFSAPSPSVPSAPAPRIRFLRSSTSQTWIDQALAHLDEILIDHAHCERKAAGVALNLLCRYPSEVSLIHALPSIAREELEHFEQVHRILEERGIPLRPLTPPPYGAKLKTLVRPCEPQRFLDSLLIAALIEARSHERLGLLGEHCPDPRLAAFYRGLMASEARHYGAYWLLAIGAFPRQDVDDRLGEIASAEADILETLHPEPRIHS